MCVCLSDPLLPLDDTFACHKCESESTILTKSNSDVTAFMLSFVSIFMLPFDYYSSMF